MPFVSIMNVLLYYQKIIFHVRKTMTKTAKERQAKRREKLRQTKKLTKHN